MNELSIISNVASILGLIISIFTLANTKSIKKAVDSKLDLVDLSENLPNYLAEINKYMQLISSNTFSMLDTNQRQYLKGLFMDIKQKYPKINKEIRTDCKKAINILNKPNSYEFTYKEVDEISRCLRTLKNLLPQEVR